MTRRRNRTPRAARRRWNLIGIPVVLLATSLLMCSFQSSWPFVTSRDLHTHVATGTFAIETRPPSTPDAGVFLYNLTIESRFVDRVVWAPGTLRRVAKQFNIPPNELLGTASPARKEMLTERAFGDRDQRSYAVVRQQAPYEVLSDGYVSDPLVRVRVRGPDQESAARVLDALPAATNAELDELAGGKSRLVVEDRSGAGTQTSGIPEKPTFVAVFLVLYFMWLVLGALIARNRAPRSFSLAGVS